MPFNVASTDATLLNNFSKVMPAHKRRNFCKQFYKSYRVRATAAASPGNNKRKRVVNFPLLPGKRAIDFPLCFCLLAVLYHRY